MREGNSLLLIDIQAVRDNTRAVLDMLPRGTALIPVLKDDAYGLGAAAISRVLAEFPAIRCVAVAHISEGLALRRAGWQPDILVMGGAPGHLVPAAVEHGLTLAVGRPELVPLLAKAASESGKTATAHVKIETGLNRYGLAPGQELLALSEELATSRAHVRITGAFSHLADADDAARTGGQHRAFLAGVSQLEAAGIAIPVRHLAASAGLEHYPQLCMDAVRIGRRLYMDHPSRPLGGVREAVTWRSWITSIRRLSAGSPLGYGGGVRLAADSDVATVAVGYGDGLNPRLAEAGAPVLVGGKRARLLTCCMDQCLVDVTGIDCAPDDEITFFGYDSAGNFLSAQEAASFAPGREGCDLTACLGSRVDRVYVNVECRI